LQVGSNYYVYYYIEIIVLPLTKILGPSM